MGISAARASDDIVLSIKNDSVKNTFSAFGCIIILLL